MRIRQITVKKRIVSECDIPYFLNIEDVPLEVQEEFEKVELLKDKDPETYFKEAMNILNKYSINAKHKMEVTPLTTKELSSEVLDITYED